MAPGTERQEAAFVRAALAGTRFAVVDWVGETGSTNDDLALAAQKGSGERVLITDLQTSGRGRRGRVWDAPSRSSVLMSILIRQHAPEDGFWSVGAIALAASEAIGARIVAPCTLKWPNDVMIGHPTEQKKVAGVLAQVVDGAVIVGIGLNVNWPDEVPSSMAERGTSVNRHLGPLATGAVVDRPDLAADILRRAIGHLEAPAAVLRERWKAGCSTIGQSVRVELQARPSAGTAAIRGIAVDVQADGALVVSRDGEHTVHHVGDVVHLRTAQ